MRDVRVDLCHTLNADSQLFFTCRKYIKVALFDGEFGKATKTEREITCRNYTQAAATLRRIGCFFKDLTAKDGDDNPLYPDAPVITGLKVGAVVITISEMVQREDGDVLEEAIVYDIPIDNGIISGYTRKVTSVMTGSRE